MNKIKTMTKKNMLFSLGGQTDINIYASLRGIPVVLILIKTLNIKPFKQI